MTVIWVAIPTSIYAVSALKLAIPTVVPIPTLIFAVSRYAVVVNPTFTFS